MSFKIFISSAIVSAIVTVIGSIITTVIAQRSAKAVAQETANQEIKKLERTWEREDAISSDDEFSAMVKAASAFIHSNNFATKRSALEEIAVIRAKEAGELAKIADDLYSSVRADKKDDAERILDCAIRKRRELRTPKN